MPRIFELFGFPIEDKSNATEQSRKSALCPFMEAKCDGGGNRNQTRISLSSTEPLSQYFSDDINNVIPGICSIVAGADTWVVCPRRLFASRNTGTGVPITNYALQQHEREILQAAGIPSGQDIGIWSEVYIKQQIADAEINYHFDYIATPLQEMSLRDFLRKFNLSEDDLEQEITNFSAQMRKKGYYPKGDRNVADRILRLPSMENPIIFEVMTASTSGSDTEQETDIRSAFRNAILTDSHESPGINKRQVWGRMVTQLFAKTALAHAWGGQTLWIIQDELLRNIELTTLLRTSKIARNEGSDIDLIVMQYLEKGGATFIALKDALTGDSGLEFTGNETFTDILLPKTTPPKLELARAMLRRSIDGIIHL